MKLIFIFIFTENDVQKVRDKVPDLETVVGTAKLHEVTTSSGQLVGKNLSTDDVPKILKLKTSEVGMWIVNCYMR